MLQKLQPFEEFDLDIELYGSDERFDRGNTTENEHRNTTETHQI